MAVLCGINGGSAQDVIIAVLSAGLEKESNDALINIEKFGNIEAFWALIQKYTGYQNSDDRPLSELAAHILITALSQTMPASALRGLERFVPIPTRRTAISLFMNGNVATAVVTWRRFVIM
ncbi:MAG: hypothetical protein ACOX4X_02820 [Aminobacterium colombiense]|uniref:hypothetical protein n=1 Tax=Aminobacterium colombiense TaxID=81468 RepID=UPI003D966DAA